MQFKLTRNHLLICLLLCSLFITSYASVLSANGTAFSDVNVFNGSSLSGTRDYSALNSKGTDCLIDYMASSSLDLALFSVRISRLPNLKSAVDLLTSIIAAITICRVYSSHLSQTICLYFDSNQITAFLHKKDGMK